MPHQGGTTTISGRHGELRYYSHTVALIASWTRDHAKKDPRVGTTVARITFSPRAVNSFWAGFGTPTHVALPARGGGRRRVYELVTCDLGAGKASFRTPPCAIEEPR